jgi:hypothetical protein
MPRMLRIRNEMNVRSEKRMSRHFWNQSMSLKKAFAARQS